MEHVETCIEEVEEYSDTNADDHDHDCSLHDRMRESLAVAEALAQASLCTSAAAKRRLAARRLHYDASVEASDSATSEEYIPPKQLLLYLVRMGSFHSTPKILNMDTCDADVILPERLTSAELLNFCAEQRCGCLPIINRQFEYNGDKKNISNQTDSNFYDPLRLRILQWNVLSQTLAQHTDSFICCPPEALEWSYRRYAIVEEIIRCAPDIICLQEVDHFNFLCTTLGTQGYVGQFVPKPDSPCIYIADNNGPDGCAIFYNSNKFECLQSANRILEVWRVQSNQVSIVMTLRVKETGKKICVATTHLKAKKGALLAKMRNEQGRDLLEFIFSFDNESPTIICGDFNAEPNEPLYETIITNNKKKLASAYATFGLENVETAVESLKLSEREPPYTTWKVREEGEICHTIDYIFYNPDDMRLHGVLKFPTDEAVGPGRVPSLQYPSDHFSLVCDMYLK